jgi:arylsulfatase A-like enzyme
LNVILVLIDSLNRHHLSAYETSPVSTPNLDRLFEKAWRFDNHFVGSLPCMPARREIFAGRKDFLWRPWGPLEPFDDRLPRLLEQRGYSTAIVTDHYHYWEEEANGYMQSVQGAACPGPREGLLEATCRQRRARAAVGAEHRAVATRGLGPPLLR